MKTQRQLLMDAFKVLRKQGYQVIWKRSTGFREFDVSEGKAGFDIRFCESTSRWNKPDFSNDGRLLDRIYVGWQPGELANGQVVNENEMFRAIDMALKNTDIEVLCCGPNGNYSMLLQPKFQRLK